MNSPQRNARDSSLRRRLPRVHPDGTTTARRRGFAFGLFVAQVAVITLIAAVAAGIAVFVQADQVRHAAEGDLEVLADSVATLPVVIEGLQSADPHAVIQPVTSAMQEAAGVSYITVVDLDNLRVAHPWPELVGKPVSSDHSGVRAGERFVGSEEDGPVGLTLRAKVPVIAPDGSIVGTVSAGVPLRAVQQEVAGRALQIIVPTLFAVLLGLVVSWTVTARLRRRLYGVEPGEMLALVQSRAAMTDGVQDGVIGIDDDGRIAFMNAGAKRLLAVAGPVEGRHAREALPAAVAALLDTETRPGTRQLITAGRTLVVTRSTAVADGRAVGSTLVIQDRSELESMLATLGDERARSGVLRVEAHDFDNRMHVVAGLLRLGEFDDASSYLDSLPRAERPGASAEWQRIQSPVLAALLASRQAQADAEGITLTISEDSRVAPDVVVGPAELTVVGNLLSNAIEAADSSIEVFLFGDGDGLELIVDDDGPGVSEADAQHIFESGRTSKEADGWRHGIGLAVVHDHVAERGGEISIDRADLGGARFQVQLPAPSASSPHPEEPPA
ncbi:ATP-binding protein [Cryobacterium sp. W22_MBD10_FK3]|uniref:sensor histidine kinase n=1 Tax=Cryobacterium sp. W22_MBD10_FK3 TaxID=3240273 RepID=UPI003F8FDB3A